MGNIRVIQSMCFQLHDAMTLQNTMIKHQVNFIIPVIYQQALLFVFETEPHAHLHYEFLQVPHNGLFQLILTYGFLGSQAKKLKEIWRFDFLMKRGALCSDI